MSYVGLRRARRLRQVAGSGVATLMLVALLTPSASAASGTESGSIGGVRPPVTGWHQDPALLAAKNEGRLSVNPNGTVAILAQPVAAPAAYPAHLSLNHTTTGQIAEPPGSGTDNAGKAYTDRNYWNLCSEGASAVMLW